MNQARLIDKILSSHSLISDQVDKDQLRIILDELDRALNRTTGVVVEFGCYIGTTSLFIRRLLDARADARDFFAYDSFEGLPAKTSTDSSRAGEQFQQGELKVSKKQFLLQFKKANLRPPTVVKAWFGDLTAAQIPDPIGFVFLDGDFYQSIRDSLRLALFRLQPGGTMIIDDYAREALPGVAKAVHEFINPAQVRTAHNLGIIRG